MAEVKCAFGGESGLASQMYWCSYDELWICKNHVIVGFASGPKCPRCSREVKK